MYGYCRCSTNESKQDITRQIRELKKIGVNEKNIFWEYEKGDKTDRLQLNRLLDIIKAGDSIATTEVSRLSRSTKQLCEIIEFAKEKKLELIIGNFKVDCRKELEPMTQGMILMWAVFSEMEKNIISQRVKSGLANSRAKGVVLGRPATSIENLPSNFLKHYPKYRDKQINLSELARLCDFSRQTAYKYIGIYENKEAE